MPTAPAPVPLSLRPAPGLFIRAVVPPDPVPIGSEAHKTLFCRTLLDTFNPYRPAVVDRPRLETPPRERPLSLPICDIAVQTEARTGLRIKTYGERIRDSLLAKAIALNAFEESGHKLVLANIVQAYGGRLHETAVRVLGNKLFVS